MHFVLAVLLAAGAALLAGAAGVWLLVRVLGRAACLVQAPPALWADDDEAVFVHGATGATVRFGSAEDAGRPRLSLVIPAYREERRLPGTLETYLGYLEGRRARAGGAFSYEVVVVDDGSPGDGTYETAMHFARKYPETVRVLRLRRNRGKGGAVRRGVAVARGELVVFADADGATEIGDCEAFEEALRAHGGVAIGQRRVARNRRRQVLADGFRMLVSLLCVRGITDTQCGFKMFDAESARRLFPRLHLERWAFDVELLFLAQRMGIPITQVPVHWEEKEGSQVDPIKDSVKMAIDLVRIRVLYALGLWS